MLRIKVRRCRRPSPVSALRAAATTRVVAEYSRSGGSCAICFIETAPGLPRLVLTIESGTGSRSIPIRNLSHGFDLARAALDSFERPTSGVRNR